MDTNQIYSLVNSVVSQGLGDSNLTAYDARSLISLGDVILSSNTNTEAFLNTLVQRIGRTIISFRAYTNKLGDMVLNDFEYGAILQKIKVAMPSAVADPSYGLTDGQAVDHYIVSKPDVEQKLFVTRTPYMFYVTIQREHLKEAFTSEGAMGGFLSAIFGEVQNAIELALEDLGRACLSNLIAEVATDRGEVQLVSMYNTLTGETLDASTAQFDPAFLRFAVKTITLYSKKLTDMSSMYNDGSVTRHTPKADQRLRVLSDFESNLETVVQYSAFNKEMVELKAFSEINFWQSAKSPDVITLIPASATGESPSAVTIENVVALLYDRDAAGIYKKEEIVTTTPVNASGLYYNTFYHEKQLWFNDLSENAVVFTLN